MFQGIVYIMGGSSTPDDLESVNYEVLAVNLRTKEVSEAADTIEGTRCSAGASSLNRIILCGGERGRKPLKCCQIYSPESDRLVLNSLK